ncbi:MAG: SusD/RagB family nutrient-binding outer membrane lipoprotein [Bacteroidales bacterium]|nr:SusD/RagB family nutrient-binding outer membrane lipoprotein [Bacteroidales bacterium]
MKIKHIILAAVAIGSVGMGTTSCTSKFDDYNTNQDATTKVTPAMLATSVILNIMELGRSKYFVYDNMLNKQIAWAEGGAEDDQYNKLGRVSYSAYTNITDCQKMLLEAESSTEAVQNSYKGLAKFIKAYQLFYLSMQVGDIPYSESNGAEEGNIKPAYDTQKEVMAQILNDLEEAQGFFASGDDFDGDPILGGDPESWRKVAVAFEMKVLINLSRKVNDSDLRVKERFAQLANGGHLMTSNADNLQLVYSNTSGQLYPLYQNDHMQYLMISSTLVDPLKRFNDYRLFYYAAPCDYALSNGFSDTDWEAYMGIDPSAIQSENNVLHGEGKDCGPNDRYLQPEGEPLIHIGYMEQNFILAEAALRNWIDPNKASEYYKKGIRASMEFIADATPDNEAYHHGHPITADYIDEYLGQAAIQLNGDFDHDLEMILLQKYLGSYLQHPDNDCFYDNRRTGYPVLPLNPESNMNTDPNKFPVRWMYPQSELDYNKENVQAAIDRQYNGNDDFNQVMWILQN